jgi:thiamine biosynthesis lipoprotein
VSPSAPAPAIRRVLVPRDIAAPPRPPEGGVLHALDGRCMGTGWSVRVAAAPGLALEPLRQGIQRELDDVVAQMSHWDEHSDLGRFNRAPAGHWQALPAAFLQVLQYALSVAADSGGACDPAAGALVNLWGFGPDPARRHDQPGFRAPQAGAIGEALACSGWQRLRLDAAAGRIRQPGGLQLDLSAVAKGHAVDRVAGYLDAAGLPHHLVEIGGELRGSGVKPDGQPWWVQLEPPTTAPSAGLAEHLVALHGLSVATSGDYRRYFIEPGEGGLEPRRLPHTLDPRTGRPIANGLASVSVLHPQCMAADALSTALTVLGPVKGPLWADERGIAALFITRRAGGGFGEHMTRAFAALA